MDVHEHDVLVLGGGIHGVGVLHDLASRGMSRIALLERDVVGSGTSSRSTKLIHGGLRYLKRISQFGMVRESLRERQILLRNAPDLVQPLQCYIPVAAQGGTPQWMVKIGIYLYEYLAGSASLGAPGHCRGSIVKNVLPYVRIHDDEIVQSFWDGQTDDVGLTIRVATSAENLGGEIYEGMNVKKLSSTAQGWEVDVVDVYGAKSKWKAPIVINALGPWANTLLEHSGISPTHDGVLNKGVHLVFPDLGLKGAVLLESHIDQRLFFLLPWQGQTLVGTTEQVEDVSPDELCVDQDSVDYLLSSLQPWLSCEWTQKDIIHEFAGWRWLAVEKGQSATKTSREWTLGELPGEKGPCWTIYGGKLTSYRKLCERIGDRVVEKRGGGSPSQTALAHCWAKAGEFRSPLPSLSHRFDVGVKKSS
ncbi:MAG: glycerol-3-phosphate dehydrogenase/oxidase [Oligoflexales bacterium]